MPVISRIRRYVPEVAENKQPDNQFSVILKAANVYTRNNELKKFMQADAKQLMQDMTSRDKAQDIQKILEEHVVKFENLEIEDADGNKHSATVKDLYDLGEYQLCLDIFMNIMSHANFTKVAEKNSGSPSGSQATNGENETTTADAV